MRCVIQNILESRKACGAAPAGLAALQFAVKHLVSVAALRLSVVVLSCCCAVHAADAPDPQDSLLSRVYSAFASEPLISLSFRNANSAAGKMNATQLAQMVNDSTYANGRRKLVEYVDQLLGPAFREAWPELSKLMNGPVIFAVGKDAGGLRIAMTVYADSADSAAQINELWGRINKHGVLMPVLQLKTLTPDQIPAPDKVATWAAAMSGDIQLRILPKQLAELLSPVISIMQLAKSVPPESSQWLQTIKDLPFERVSLESVFLNGGFSEKLTIETAAAETPEMRLIKTLREKPAAWETLESAIPHGEDAIVMMQFDLPALKTDLPYAMQAVERVLRGKKWAAGEGSEEPATSERRFDFLTQRFQGSFALTGRPALSGDMRLTMATALNPEPIDDTRAALIAGFSSIGADFETIETSQKIGGELPLGAKFDGRGVLPAPFLAVSPGWVWLCSSSVAYTELVETLRARSSTRKKEKRPPDPFWSAADALRIEITLERVVKLGYAWWLLGSDGGPQIGGWKVPGDLLPVPAIFTGRMGVLQLAVARAGGNVSVRSQCVIPGTSLLSIGMIEGSAEGIRRSRAFARDAKDTRRGGAPGFRQQ